MLQRLVGRGDIDDDTLGRLATVAPDWEWPFWLQRQLDVSSPAFVVGADDAMSRNVSGRNWTSVGVLGSPLEAVVDPRGLVSPSVGGWSLDWWVGAEDRWHVPARSANVRQTLIGDSPVIETRMRVPGGDMIHRTYAINATAADGGRDLVIVEIENDSAVPVALAFGVRPYDVEGLSSIERIELHDTTVTVDGEVALLLPKEPNEVAGSTFHDGDSSATVFAGDASASFPTDLHCEVGMAQAAFVYPLPHSATIRVAIPIDAVAPRGRFARRPAERTETFPAAVPTADQVASGWRAQTDRGMRLVLPDERVQSAVDANRRYLLLLHDGDDVIPGPRSKQRFLFRDAAYLLSALDRYGFHREVGEVLLSYPERQENDGNLSSRHGESDANGAAIWALAHHWDLTRNDELARQLAPMVAGAVEWIERKRNERRDDPALRGLLPAGVSAEHLGPHDHLYWNDLWALAGLRDASRLLAAAGEDEAAARAEEFCASMTANVRASLELTADRLGTAAVPAGPRRRIDGGVIGSLAAVSPLDLLPADDKAMAATLDVVREGFCIEEAVYPGVTGLGTHLTMQLASAELQAGDRRALDRFDWLLSNATTTWTWPEAIHPRVNGGCAGDGHSGWAAAEFLSFVRSMLVCETSEGLALFSMIPERWYGQGVEIHDAPTRFGNVSFALRWHGVRPALLWEIDRHDESVPVAITCPGIDPSWRTTEDRGEALLEAPPATAVPGPEDGDSFG